MNKSRYCSEIINNGSAYYVSMPRFFLFNLYSHVRKFSFEKIL